MSHILSSLFILCYSVAFPRFCGDCPCLLFDTDLVRMGHTYVSGAARGDVCHGLIYTHGSKSSGHAAICFLVKTACTVGRFVAYTCLPALFFTVLIFNDG